VVRKAWRICISWCSGIRPKNCVTPVPKLKKIECGAWPSAAQHTVVKMEDLDLIAEFYKRHNQNTVPTYGDRETRNRWAATLLNSMAGTELLNLGGGGQRHLEKYLDSHWHVHELDKTGNCDTKLDLDEVDRLPFSDDAFDICCAFDVLEHLEKFHLIFEEMYRVSRSTLLISLPNAGTEVPVIFRNIRNFRDPLENGVYSKFYGLPIAPPTDRHRWWLSFEDIVRFCVWIEKSRHCTVEFFIPDNEFSIKRRIFRLLAGERLYLNFFCSSVWIRIVKRA